MVLQSKGVVQLRWSWIRKWGALILCGVCFCCLGVSLAKKKVASAGVSVRNTKQDLFNPPSAPLEIEPVKEGEHKALNVELPDTKWAEFKALKSKILKTAKEQELFYSELESSEFVSKAFATLDAIPTNTEKEVEDRTKRMEAIDWISEALTWKDNPRRAELLERVSQLVGRDLSNLSVEASAKQTLIGDKIELIGILAAVNPTLASELEGLADETRERKLFKYAKSMYGLRF